MRIWTRKSASIQPRTSLRKSAVSWPAELAHKFETVDGAAIAGKDYEVLLPELPGLGFLSNFGQHSVKISLNLSKICINSCIQYSIYQHFSKSTNFCKILQKILQNFAKLLRISENFRKFCEICQKMSKFLQKFQKF